MFIALAPALPISTRLHPPRRPPPSHGPRTRSVMASERTELRASSERGRTGRSLIQSGGDRGWGGTRYCDYSVQRNETIFEGFISKIYKITTLKIRTPAVDVIVLTSLRLGSRHQTRLMIIRRPSGMSKEPTAKAEQSHVHVHIAHLYLSSLKSARDARRKTIKRKLVLYNKVSCMIIIRSRWALRRIFLVQQTLHFSHDVQLAGWRLALTLRTTQSYNNNNNMNPAGFWEHLAGSDEEKNSTSLATRFRTRVGPILTPSELAGVCATRAGHIDGGASQLLPDGQLIFSPPLNPSVTGDGRAIVSPLGERPAHFLRLRGGVAPDAGLY
ncbi:hypothetical protein EVAR_87100_1 [Eumeta japonica]|uniref:Uncharacterized protein n=1 Tax=Eumeta variegata TaxID=151549 RepID=A0A4C1VR49_EUMVA|nr:hypothetical protein EVAR_87100_1 [Eumeta japonica]